MTRLANVTHSLDGYQLRVVDVPLWAYSVERVGEWACEKTGNILCAAGLPGWAWHIGVGRRSEEGWPRWNVGSALFAFGQWFHLIGSSRERELYFRPLTNEEVAEHFPNLRAEFLEKT